MEKVDKRVVQNNCNPVDVVSVGDDVVIIKQDGFNSHNRVMVESARLEALIIALLEVRTEMRRREDGK